MSVLDEICARKAQHVATCKDAHPLDKLQAVIDHQPATRGFINAIKSSDDAALIAEVKKASPSKGIIRANFDPVKIAQTYESAGATCLSVLTDEPYFQGADEYLVEIKKNVSLPLLRKDFMIDPYQIFESRILGADCILLIMAALSDVQAADLYELATDLDMDVLVEVHNAEELERAKSLKPAMIGVNNRNLKTLDVDIRTSYDLLQQMPENTIKVAESGISDPDTIEELHTNGFNVFLVGESLMKQDDIALATRTLLKK
ncbi:MAG: indole-3-glycerol phosphate synthase TrpC [Micavibrio sp.]|nr:indole-3-glycerol phosphate synthase TrpC [Micavibrio sp.]